MSKVNVKIKEFNHTGKYPKFWKNKNSGKIICESESNYVYISGGTEHEKLHLSFGETVLGMAMSEYVPFFGGITIAVN